MAIPVKKVCETCGSDDVQIDAWAEWDFENQMWTLGPVFDTSFCVECDGDTTIIDVPGRAETPYTFPVPRQPSLT